jgi:glutathione-regulated potassium-efflux system ancillary protein KefF
MKRTLVIVAHQHFAGSVTGKTIVEHLKNQPELEQKVLSIRILDEMYPDFKINIKVEQDALLMAENVVLQFPFFWYNVPGILKQWLDEVLEYGFAYGKTGDKLKGKNLILSLSTGGIEEAYTYDGRNHAPVADYLLPMKQTAFLTGMNYIDPVISYGMVNIKGIEMDREPIVLRAKEHSERLYNLLKIL